MVYELGNSPINPSNNFAIKIVCLEKSQYKNKQPTGRKFIYNYNGIAFDASCSWSFSDKFD